MLDIEKVRNERDTGLDPLAAHSTFCRTGMLAIQLSYSPASETVLDRANIFPYASIQNKYSSIIRTLLLNVTLTVLFKF